MNINKRFLMLMLLISLIGCTVTAKKEGSKGPAEKPAAISTKQLNELDKALKTGLPVVLKLGSDRCYPCRLMNPIIKELSQEQKGKIIFLNLDIYKNRELADRFKVNLIPTIIFFDKKGALTEQTTGYMSKVDLLKKIESLGLK